MALIVLALWLVVRACETGGYGLAAGRRGGAGGRLRREDARVARRAAGTRAARLAGHGRSQPAKTRAAKLGAGGGVRRRRARVAERDAAVSRARAAVGDRLDERQRVERRVRVQRHRPARRQVGRTAAPSISPARIPGRDPVRARPHPDRAALADPAAGADRAAVGRAAGARAARRAAAGHPGAGGSCRRRHASRSREREPGPRRGLGRGPGRRGRGRGRRDGYRRRGACATGRHGREPGPHAARRGGRADRVAATGIALFSDMARLHPRYVEGLVPAVAATLGIGVAWAASGERAAARRSCWSSRSPRPCTTSSGCCTDGRACGGCRSRARSARSRRGARAPGPRCKRRIRAALSQGRDRADALRGARAARQHGHTAIEDRVGDAGYVGALPGEEQRR